MVPQPLHKDSIKWVPSPSGIYSSKSTWQAIRSRSPIVPWHSLVWFPKAIPKAGFILWLAIRGRLSTQDKLHLPLSNLKCLLCGDCLENHDHLFFHCPISKSTWEALLDKCGLPHDVVPWQIHVDLMVTRTQGKDLRSTIRKLCLAVSVYHIWRERNIRLHDHISRLPNAVLHLIQDTIRCRLLSIRNIHDNEENRALLSCWHI